MQPSGAKRRRTSTYTRVLVCKSVNGSAFEEGNLLSTDGRKRYAVQMRHSKVTQLVSEYRIIFIVEGSHEGLNATHGREDVGKTIVVFWPDDLAWYGAKVVDYRPSSKSRYTHFVRYHDGETGWLDMSTEQFVWVLADSQLKEHERYVFLYFIYQYINSHYTSFTSNANHTLNSRYFNSISTFLRFPCRHQKTQQARGMRKPSHSPIPEAVKNVLVEAAKRQVTKPKTIAKTTTSGQSLKLSKSDKKSSSSSSNDIPSTQLVALIPASAKHLGHGDWDIERAHLPVGAIVKARILEASNSNMQEHYTARVVRTWPNPKTDSRNRGAENKSQMIALNFIDPKLTPHLPPVRKGKPAPTYYVEPNDVEECRLMLKSSMVTDGRIEPGSKISARYLFQGKRVRGWTGFYPATVTEHCQDGTVLVRYMHEDPVHEEYVQCKDVQFAALHDPVDV
jgi:hypothetical protein